MGKDPHRRGGAVFYSATTDVPLLTEKLRRAEEIGTASGLFVVPRVLDADPERGVVTLERIEGLRTLGTTVGPLERDSERVCTQLGRALPVVHRELVLPPEMRHPLPPPWRTDHLSSVCIHGDLTPSNVCWRPADKRLVIVDWATAPLFGEKSTIGPPCFDAVWFATTLFHAVPLRRQPLSKPRRLAGIFLRAYLEAGGLQSVDLTGCFESMEQLWPVIVARPAATATHAQACLSPSIRFRHRVLTKRHRQWRTFVSEWSMSAARGREPDTLL